MCRTTLAEWRQPFPVDSINHSPATTGTRSASVWTRHCSSTGLAGLVAAEGCNVCVCLQCMCADDRHRRFQRNLQLCNNLVRVSVNQLEGC